MNTNKLVFAAALVCACVGATMAAPRPSPGRYPGPGVRGPAPIMRGGGHHGGGHHHGGHHGGGYYHGGFHRPGPGFHRLPPPPSLHGWHRGLRAHAFYRSCWYDGVWYDAYGYPYTAPAVVVPAPAVVPVTTTTVVPTTTTVVPTTTTVVPATTTVVPTTTTTVVPAPAPATTVVY